MSLDLYPEPVYEGDLSPDNVGEDLETVCEDLKKGFKGFGTDEDRVLSAMGTLSMNQRCYIGMKYKEKYGDDLKDVLKSECGKRDFGFALQMLSLPPHEMEVHLIRKAGKGLGTDERLLHSIVCGRSNRDMEILKKTFFDVYTKDLGQYLASELGGNMEALIINCLQASEEAYDEGYHNEEKMKADVAALYKMGQGKWGTDEKGFFKLLCASPPEYLQKVNLAYADKHGLTLMKAMETELGGDAGNAGLFMLGMKLKPHLTIAKLIKQACKGFGTDETLLTATLLRYQKVLKPVMEAFIEEYGESIQDVVRSETRGDYEKVLIKYLDSISE